jgi:hypothetical protein
MTTRRQWLGFGAAAAVAVLIASAMALTLIGVGGPAPDPGTALEAPVAPATPSAAAPSGPPSAAPLPVGVEQADGVTYYTVQPYDIGRRDGTLAFIAGRFGTTVAQLVEWNNIPDPDVIHPGQRLRVR